jgi:hypothetical protein
VSTLFIDGKWVESSGGARCEVINHTVRPGR